MGVKCFRGAFRKSSFVTCSGYQRKFLWNKTIKGRWYVLKQIHDKVTSKNISLGTLILSFINRMKMSQNSVHLHPSVIQWSSKKHCSQNLRIARLKAFNLQASRVAAHQCKLVVAPSQRAAESGMTKKIGYKQSQFSNPKNERAEKSLQIPATTTSKVHANWSHCSTMTNTYTKNRKKDTDTHNECRRQKAPQSVNRMPKNAQPIREVGGDRTEKSCICPTVIEFGKTNPCTPLFQLLLPEPSSGGQ